MNNKKNRKINYGGNNMLEDWRFWIGVVLILLAFYSEGKDRGYFGNDMYYGP